MHKNVADYFVKFNTFMQNLQKKKKENTFLEKLFNESFFLNSMFLFKFRK